MEKACEFCAIHRSMVYCNSDAAYLCLTCDAKVHSANTLSYRHFRALVCESCMEQPAIVRCLVHRMLLCHGCDRGLHDRVSSYHHQKHAISSYAGCPSARQFATLWGFDVDELLVYGSTAVLPDDPSLARSRGSLHRGSRGEMSRFGASTSQVGVSSLGSPLGSASSAAVCLGSTSSPSGSRRSKMLRKDQLHQQQSTSLVKQQILDLRRLQIHEGNSNDDDNNNNKLGFPLICRRGRQQQSTSSIATVLTPLDKDNIAPCRNSEHDLACLGELDNLNPKPNCFVSPVSQWDHLSCSAIGDPFWQCNSSIEDSQFWTQSLEELESCGEVDCFDDLNMPDVDVTFRSFEELFAGGQGLDRGTLQDFDAACLSFGKNDRSDNCSRTGGQIASSSIHASNSANEGRHIDPSDQTHQFSKSMENPDDGGDDHPSTTEGMRLQEARDGCTTRNREGKKARLHGKQIPMPPRKGKADARKRIRDRQQLALQ